MLTSAARAADARYSLECHGIQNVNNVYAIARLLATTGATTVIGDSDSASAAKKAGGVLPGVAGLTTNNKNQGVANA